MTNCIKSLFLIIVLLSVNTLNAQNRDVNITDKFPCQTFRYALWRGKVITDTARIMQAETEKVKKLKLNISGEISSFAGLEQFKALEDLYLSWGRGDSIYLDLSGNRALRKFTCNSDRLYRLNIRKCRKLEILNCRSFLLDTVDVSQNKELKELRCGDGNSRRLKCILLPGKSSLEILCCTEALSMSGLNPANSPRLRVLKCSNHQLKTLDISRCTRLDTLICQSGELDTLDLSHCPGLTYLDCSYNRIRSLDLSRNTQLSDVIVRKQESRYLICEGVRSGKLQTLILPDNTRSKTGITTLICEDNQLQTLNVSRSVYLKNLNCSLNRLKKIDLSHNPELTELNCSYNYIRSLDLRSNLKLEKVHCGSQGYQWIRQAGKDYKLLKELFLPDQSNASTGNRLTVLSYPGSDLKTPVDLPRYPQLHHLNCSDNRLESLDTDSLPELTELYCHGNPIPSLSLKNNRKLSGINIRWMPLTEIDFTQNKHLTRIECLNSPDRGNLLILLPRDKNTDSIEFKTRYIEDDLFKRKDGELICLPPKYITIKKK